MNTIFGIWRPRGASISSHELSELAAHTARFTSDGEHVRCAQEIGMGVQTWHTHLRSHLDSQPLSDHMGNLLVYDGRLDNHCNVVASLGMRDRDPGDCAIILEAYRRWGQDCFAMLIGDWALSLWDSQSKTLFLARDHAGTRTLYYSRDTCGTVVWSTNHDAFLGTDLLTTPDEQYLASYLAMLPNYRRSPYRGVESVLPGHLVQVNNSGTITRQLWTPLVHDRIVLKSDRDYDECFLELFEQAVARRTCPGAPILAQLSGGMDSSSIVCVSDRIHGFGNENNASVDTLSYFDDSDPSWNEKPYFTIVETKRGKSGFHLDASQYETTFDKSPTDPAMYLYPGTSLSELRMDSDLRSLVGSAAHRVIISGIGGDELTGGVVDPAAELADEIAAGRILAAVSRTTSWCLANRCTFASLFSQSIHCIFNRASVASLDHAWEQVPWLTKQARAACHVVTRETPSAIYRPWSIRPSAVEACHAWWYMLRTQPHLRPSEIIRFEYRYPYLDRDLVDFLLRIPPSQLAGPGRRRLMMRRALKGIVPEEILERRRKAYLLRSPLRRMNDLAPKISYLIDHSLLADMGLVSPPTLRTALEHTLTGKTLQWWALIIRFAQVETWLRHRDQIRSQPAKTKDSVERYTSTSTDAVPTS